MVFTNSNGIKPLKGTLTIGADAAATAGPIGRKAEAGTDILLKSVIYTSYLSDPSFQTMKGC